MATKIYYSLSEVSKMTQLPVSTLRALLIIFVYYVLVFQME